MKVGNYPCHLACFVIMMWLKIVYPVKAQIGLVLHLVKSESLLCTLFVDKSQQYLQATSFGQQRLGF